MHRPFKHIVTNAIGGRRRFLKAWILSEDKSGKYQGPGIVVRWLVGSVPRLPSTKAITDYRSAASLTRPRRRVAPDNPETRNKLQEGGSRKQRAAPRAHLLQAIHTPR